MMAVTQFLAVRREDWEPDRVVYLRFEGEDSYIRDSFPGGIRHYIPTEEDILADDWEPYDNLHYFKRALGSTKSVRILVETAITYVEISKEEALRVGEKLAKKSKDGWWFPDPGSEVLFIDPGLAKQLSNSEAPE